MPQKRPRDRRRPVPAKDAVPPRLAERHGGSGQHGNFGAGVPCPTLIGLKSGSNKKAWPYAGSERDHTLPRRLAVTGAGWHTWTLVAAEAGVLVRRR